MRKTISVLAILVVALLCMGVEEAKAASTPVSSIHSFSLTKEDGTPVTAGSTLQIEPTGLLRLTLVPLDYYTDYVSGDIRTHVVGISPNLIDQGSVHLYYNTSSSVGYGTVEITTNNAAVDQLISIQLVTTITPVEGTAISNNSEVFYLRLQSNLATDFNYLFVPKSMRLVDERGTRVTSIYMEAAQTKELYAEVDDYLNDGYADNDYDVYPVSSNTFNMAPTVQSAAEASLMGTSTTPTLVGLTPTLPTMMIPPRTIARVTITSRNPGGDQTGNYQPVYTDFAYQITFGGTTTAGVSLANILPNAGVIQTPRVSVVIYAKDDATGTFDDGGGSCDFLGLGALALLVPAALIRRKK